MKKIFLGIALAAIVCFSFGALAQDTKTKTKTETQKTIAPCCAATCESKPCVMQCSNAAANGQKGCCQTEKVIQTKKVEARKNK